MREIHAVIAGLGSYLPEKVYTNADMEQMVDTNDEWIVQRTGIRERHIAREDEYTSDLATEAAKRALADAGMAAEELDMILLATVSPDMYTPSVSCLVQRNIGAVNATCMDINTACSGFVSALSVADQFIRTGHCKKVLVIGADTLSKITNYADRGTCILFGDGAGAAVIEARTDAAGVIGTTSGADGASAEKLYCGGLHEPEWYDEKVKPIHQPRTLWMNGSEVMKFAVRAMANAANKVIAGAGLTVDDIDWVIPHQANIRIIDGARKRMGIAEEKVFTNLAHVGNMSGASIPVALCEAHRQGKLQKGDKIILVGFGAGLTWAAALLEWNK